MGSYVITLVGPSFRLPVSLLVSPSLNISSDGPLVLSDFLHEVRAPLGYKSDKSLIFEKKSLGVTNWEKTHFGGIYMFLVHISASSHLNFLKFHVHNKLNII